MSKLILGMAIFALLMLAGCAQGGAQSDLLGDTTGGAAGVGEATRPQTANSQPLETTTQETTSAEAPTTVETAPPAEATPPTGATTPTGATAPTETAPSAADIGEARAKEIALGHAGYTAEEVQRLRVERDYDDGRFEYEVEFFIGRTEYSYEIDAASGAVLSYEAEQDH